MGGGGAMRAAAKVAGMGVFSGGLRSEHPVVAAAARKAARPLVSSSEDVKLVASAQSDGANASTPIQRSFWEIDDWEFAEDELVMQSGEPMPRLVFGGAPTLQEAKEATSELKDVLEQTYLSPNVDGFANPLISGRDSGLLLPSNSEHLEAKPCLTREDAVTSSAPKHAIQAFSLLSDSPVAQTVVASIASDPNVWNAVMLNEALVEFLQSQKTSVAFSDMGPSMDKVVVGDAESQNHQFSEGLEESCDSSKSSPGNWFMVMFGSVQENITAKVVEMMNSLSATFWKFFAGGEPQANANGTAPAVFMDGVVGKSFMGLAIMVIILVVLKRG